MQVGRPIVAAFGASLMAAMALAAGPAVAEALIVDAEGEIAPAAEPFAEAPDGAVFRLGDGAQMILLHYAACVETHFRGGEVTVGPTGLSTTGETVSETRVECPRKVAFTERSTGVAAVVLRGGPDVVRINGRPVFVLLADGAERVEISRGDAVVARLAFEGRIAKWPADAPPLPAGDGYAFAIVGAGATTGPKAGAAVAMDAGVTIVAP